MGHLIHRQILELKFSTQEDAERWSPRLAELNQQIVLPALEWVFAEQVGDFRLLRIDRLEIDLGRLRQSDFENDLAVALRRSLNEVLQPYLLELQPLGPDVELRQIRDSRKELKNSAESQVAAASPSPHLLEPQPLGPDVELQQTRGSRKGLENSAESQTAAASLPSHLLEPQSPGPGADRKIPVDHQIDAESLRELVEVFLQTGRCPWWLKRELAGQLDRLYQRLWHLAPEAAGGLMRRMIADPLALQRFIEQFSNRSHRLTLQRLPPPGTGELLVDLRRLATRLLSRQGYGTQARSLSLKLIYALLVVSEQRQFEQPLTLLREFLLTLAQVSGIPQAKISEAVDGAVARTRLASSTTQLLAEFLRRSEMVVEEQEISQARPRPVAFESAVVVDEQVETFVVENEVPVDNAGLVLLWPHLKELLRKLDLLETLADGQQRPRLEAVLLLQQLVSGRPAGQENLLVLNKLLCGIPQSVPVPRRTRRSAAWSAEVDRLLTAVIKQWSALKNTSPAGLRSSFLQRQGILREQEQGWSLQVERKAQDVLLEQLPWGIGMLQFSWMRLPLQIEW